MSDNTFSVQRFRALPTEIHVMLVGTLLTRGAYFMVWPFLALLLWREFRLSASAIGLLLALRPSAARSAASTPAGCRTVSGASA